MYGVYQRRDDYKSEDSILRAIVGLLRFFVNMFFGDTRYVSLIGPEHIFSDDRHEFVIKTRMNKPLDTHEQIIGNS